MNNDPIQQNQPGIFGKAPGNSPTGFTEFQELVFKDLFLRLQMAVHQNSINKGWWEQRDAALALLKANGFGEFGENLIKGQCILLEHTELSEAVEGMRQNLQDDKCPDFPMEVVEHADVFIRMLDLAEKYKWDLIGAILAKMRMNAGRPIRHGGKAF